MTDIEDLFAAKIHEKLGELLYRPLASFVHGVDLLINVLHEEHKHELDFNLPFILVAVHHALTVLLLRLNLLVNVLDRHGLFIGGTGVVCLYQVSAFTHPNFDVHVHVCNVLCDQFVNF